MIKAGNETACPPLRRHAKDICTNVASAPGAILGAPPAAQAPQLCRLVISPSETSDWLSEIKLDGYRFIVSLDHGRVRLLTRKGLDWGRSTAARGQGIFPPAGDDRAMLDGELVVDGYGLQAIVMLTLSR